MKLGPECEKLTQIKRTRCKQNIRLTHHHVVIHLIGQLQSSGSTLSTW